VNFIIPH